MPTKIHSFRRRDESTGAGPGPVRNFGAAVLLLLLCLCLDFSWSRDSAAAVNDLLKLEAVPSKKAASSLLLDITRAGNRLVAVGELGHIIYSDDGGEKWSQARVPVMVTLTAVNFPTPRTGWAVGHDGVVLHSADGGATWVKQLDGTVANQLLLVHAERRLREGMAGSTAVGGDSADGGTEIEDLQRAVDNAKVALEEGPWKAFMDVEFEDENKGLIIGSYGMIFRTEDGGKNWIPWVDRVPNPDALHLNAFGRTRSGMFMVGESGTLYRSRDKGLHWEAVASPYQGSFFGVVTEGKTDTVIALGLRGNAFLSVDLGTSWKKIPVNVNNALNGGSLLPDGRLFILSSNVFYARNAHENFSTMELPLSAYSSMITVDDGNMIVVGFGGIHKLPIPRMTN